MNDIHLQEQEDATQQAYASKANQQSHGVVYISFLHILEVTKFQKRKTSSLIHPKNAMLLIIHRKCVLVHRNPSTKEYRNSLAHAAIL